MPSSTTGPQRSNVTHWNGTAAEFSGSALPYAAAVRAIKHFNVSFGTGEIGDKVSSIGALGAVNAEEVELLFPTEHHKAADGSIWQIRARVTSATDVTFTKEDVTPGFTGTAAASTHYFQVKRLVK